MPATGEILADFIQMRDITGVGGAAFLAGSRSTNINNSNQNWVFETAPEFLEVGFLGEDRALCSGEGITLDAYNFSPGETYRWQDGSTDTTFTTDQSGIYFVEVTFQTSCVIRDTIEVLDPQTFSVDLPDNPVICAGDTLTLVADAGINSADYLWQDGSEETSLDVFASGEYFVVVDLGGCLESDTTTLTVTELPTVDLGEDQVACAGEDFSLTADVMAESFRWQDNSMNLTFSGDQAGTYWVEAVNGSCPVRDSVMVTYVDPGLVSLGPDTAVCNADQITLDAGVVGFTYRWQDDSDQQTFTATEEGRYFVEISLSGCTAADTIEVDFVQDLFPEEIMLDFPFCEGASLELPVGNNPSFSNFRWSDGQTGPLFVTSTPGAYEVEYDYQESSNFNVCPVTVPFAVSEVPLPVVELGEDITTCTGDPVTLTISQAGVWQDGTVTASYAVMTPGRYRVEAANGPCIAADSVEVDFLPLPDFSLGADQSACEGEDLSVTVPTGLGTISWDDGLGDTQRAFMTSGIRWVDIEDANGCVGRDSVELTFTPIPVLELGQDTVACDDLPFRIAPTISGGALTWPDGSSTSEYAVVGPAPVTVVASLTDNACAITDTITVSFRECINYQAYLPTAFSPNFDGVNDDFTALFDPRVEILEFRMQVFSRWGDQLFLTEDPTQSWDGTARGQTLPIGSYLYSIEVTYRDDRGVGNDLITGDIMLTR
ncbi:MAG: gliding motility-associated C-terminal domain-containing protein, partial [Bacteroidota bacterium]